MLGSQCEVDGRFQAASSSFQVESARKDHHVRHQLRDERWTSAHMKAHNTATVDGALLATSNGHSGLDRSHLGSTRKGCVGVVRGLFGVVAVAVGMWVGRALIIIRGKDDELKNLFASQQTN
jgi:hypothetical protein